MQGTERAFEETQNNSEKGQGTSSPALIFPLTVKTSPYIDPSLRATHFVKG